MTHCHGESDRDHVAADWNIKEHKCTRGAGCQLWEDDDQLLDQDQRGAPAAGIPPHYVSPHMHDPPPRYENGEFGWMYNPGQRKIIYAPLKLMIVPDVESGQHTFTAGMLNTYSCGYCGRNQGSLQDLQAHLANVDGHPVFSCCGKIFRQQIDYQRHQDSGRHRHHNTYTRGEGA